jgi:two-component sensor histidine kinase
MLNLMLTEESGAGAAARQALRDGNGMLPAPIRDDVLLLVSELVTNAVRHAGARPERPLHVPAGNESGGWGLFLVDQITDHWGVECTRSRTRNDWW